MIDRVSRTYGACRARIGVWATSEGLARGYSDTGIPQHMLGIRPDMVSAGPGGSARWSYRRPMVEPDNPAGSGDRPQWRLSSSGVVLTRAELSILAALEDLIFELGYVPTYAQMLERIGWQSSGSLHAYLQRLREKGVIEGRGRSLRVVR